MEAGTTASGAAIRQALDEKGHHDWTPRRTLLSTTRNNKSRPKYSRRNLSTTSEFREHIYDLMNPNWNSLDMWTSGMSESGS